MTRNIIIDEIRQTCIIGYFRSVCLYESNNYIQYKHYDSLGNIYSAVLEVFKVERCSRASLVNVYSLLTHCLLVTFFFAAEN